MKLRAFTLSEVLITLTVIGVVAAITLPPLIQNYQKHVLVNRLKKSVSTVENGFKLAMAEDETDNIYDTTMFKTMENTDIFDNDAFDSFMREFRKYFKVIKSDYAFDDFYILGYKYLGGNQIEGLDEHAAIYLTDNQIIFPLIFTNPGTKKMKCWIDIDVNGLKGPNVYGRDRFSFYISESGHMIADLSKEYIEYFGVNEYNHWKNRRACNPEQNSGAGCAARIIENGWKMDY